jgi:3-dehydroquinate dehydratase I
MISEAVRWGARPLICLPLVAALPETILDHAGRLAAMQPDILEWRIDGYAEIDNIVSSLRLLAGIRRRIGAIPLLFTCRMSEEGGGAVVSAQHRLELLTAAIGSGNIDIVDTELANSVDFLATVRQVARTQNIPLLLSYHNFRQTPDEEVLLDILHRAVSTGADIAKVAVMPNNAADVLTLFRVTNRARQAGIGVPLVTVAMGQIGMISRIAGGIFGSEITFAAGLEASAPGQIPIAELRQAMAPLYTFSWPLS